MMKLIPILIQGLNADDREKFEQGPFKHIVDMGQKMILSNQLIHYMLLREVVTKRKWSMWFGVNKCLLRFSLQEFIDITGLDCSKETKEIPSLDFEEVFPGTKWCLIKEIEKLYMKEPKKSKESSKRPLY